MEQIGYGIGKSNPCFIIRLKISTRKMNILSFRNGSILEPKKKIPCKSLSNFSVAKAFASVASNGKTKKGMMMNLNL